MHLRSIAPIAVVSSKEPLTQMFTSIVGKVEVTQHTIGVAAAGAGATGCGHREIPPE